MQTLISSRNCQIVTFNYDILKHLQKNHKSRKEWLVSLFPPVTVNNQCCFKLRDVAPHLYANTIRNIKSSDYLCRKTGKTIAIKRNGTLYITLSWLTVAVVEGLTKTSLRY